MLFYYRFITTSVFHVKTPPTTKITRIPLGVNRSNMVILQNTVIRKNDRNCILPKTFTNVPLLYIKGINSKNHFAVKHWGCKFLSGKKFKISFFMRAWLQRNSLKYFMQLRGYTEGSCWIITVTLGLNFS